MMTLGEQWCFTCGSAAAVQQSLSPARSRECLGMNTGIHAGRHNYHAQLEHQLEC